MSVLINETYANPSTPLWEKDNPVVIVEAGGNGIVQTFNPTLSVTLVTKTFTAPSNGFLIASSGVNFGNTQTSASQFTAKITDTISSASTSHTISLPIGNVTNQFQSACPMLSLQLTKGQSVTMTLQVSSSILNTTYKWDWNLIFYSS